MDGCVSTKRTRRPNLCPALLATLLVVAVGACQTVTPQTLQSEIDDAVITAAVKRRISTDPVTTSGAVNVETVRNRVYLRGVVPTARERNRAQDLAIAVPGVLRVVNDLQVLEGRTL
jgi:hyperosmotically inducible periplasmic protein